MRAHTVLFLCFAAACHGTSGGVADGPDAGDGEADAEPGGDAPLLGSLKVSEVDAPYGESGVVQGSLWTSDFGGFHTEVMNDGTCRLLAYEPSFCEPWCEQGLCIDGECREYPVIDAGTLTVNGLAEEVMVAPQAYPFAGYGYWTVLDRADLFGGGDQVTVTAPGGGFPGFEVTAGGVDDLELGLENDEIRVPNGADYTFTWPAGSGDERMRVTLNSNNEFHGAPSFAIIECDAPASAGELSIPRAMIEAFPATEHWQGCAGSDCPPSHALLYRRGAAEVSEGEVELLVGSEVLFYVVHPAADGGAAGR